MALVLRFAYTVETLKSGDLTTVLSCERMGSMPFGLELPPDVKCPFACGHCKQPWWKHSVWGECMTVAQEHGVNQRVIWCVLNRRTWKHVL